MTAPAVSPPSAAERDEARTAHDGARRVAQEAARRRTFAIISHPDAGKTTLTEKLLLYGGAIHLGSLGYGSASQLPARAGTRRHRRGQGGLGA